MKELKALMDLAANLKENKYTLNVFNDGKLILKLGEGTKPGLLSPFGPIEIKDLRSVLQFLE
jgi:hypothetical protein